MQSKDSRPRLFERVKAGLEEAIAWAEGKKDLEVTVIELPEPKLDSTVNEPAVTTTPQSVTRKTVKRSRSSVNRG